MNPKSKIQWFDPQSLIHVLQLTNHQKSKIQNPKLRIIFFDGNCPMCHSWVNRVIKWDKKKMFKFAPLEGDTARNYLLPILPDYIKEDTIVYYDGDKTYLRSEAALRIIKELGFPYSFLSFGLNVPKFISDSIYRWVASRRYRFGDRFESCPLPPSEWRDRFLS